MAGKIFTEPIKILSYGITRQSGGGQSKGTLTTKYDTIGKITQRTQSRYLTDGSSGLANVFEIEFYRNPSQLIDSNDSVEWRSFKLKIRDIKESDDYRKYILTAEK